MQCKDYIPEESILNFRNMLEEASDKSYDNLVAVPLKKNRYDVDFVHFPWRISGGQILYR